ncbi:hypothetical protein R3P38DRAFT_2795777 [Favolaschia claudopus]|uniref:Uncharacterized protein n=1 Tax=Favolaschia claudopus TaxID=2862362 RepID=A0AAW0A5V5_9AGAR
MQSERAPRPQATGLRRPRKSELGPDAAPAISSSTTISVPVQPTLRYNHAPNAAPPRAAVPPSHTTINYVSTKLREEAAALLEQVLDLQQCVHDNFFQKEEVPKLTEDNIMTLLPMVIEITEIFEPSTTPYKQGLADDSLEPDEAPVSAQSQICDATPRLNHPSTPQT